MFGPQLSTYQLSGLAAEWSAVSSAHRKAAGTSRRSSASSRGRNLLTGRSEGGGDLTNDPAGEVGQSHGRLRGDGCPASELPHPTPRHCPQSSPSLKKAHPRGE